MAERRFPRLSTALLASAIVAFVVALVVVSLPIRNHVGAFERNVQSEGVMRAGHALELAVSKTLEREWGSLEAVAGQVDISTSESAGNFVEAVPRATAAIAWVGIAKANGRLLAGTGGEGKGTSVRNLAWFRDGMNGGTVGDVYVPEAMRNVPGQSRGLIDLSTPIRDSFGNAVGVVVYSMKVDWVTDYMAQAARELDVDIVVRDTGGREIFELNELIDDPIAPEILNLSATGHDLTRFDGSHVTGVFPNMLQGAMPPFGWDLIVRVPAHEGQTSLTAFMTKMSLAIASLFLALALATVFYAVHFLRPISELSRVASAIADGEEVYPPARHSSRESATLSSALVRIQSRLMEGGLRQGAE
ncbi:hypothetical protein EKE94_17910 [Mesobaculum littorinae]|uniref:HAMP domain-containing protein n=1 Tax=Mesobaculum littorinae TaxID=2486419 RepID=A0A438AD44_9RHOB|nr:cache domain-containing protein [Mesobaculum littorinae]RVV96599.1 hypothetical protein EKE94_17910 [Mesobaculum littorinae]